MSCVLLKSVFHRGSNKQVLFHRISHRAIGWLGLEGTLKTEFQPHCHGYGCHSLDQAPGSHPGMGQPQFLWSACSSTSSPSD